MESAMKTYVEKVAELVADVASQGQDPAIELSRRCEEHVSDESKEALKAFAEDLAQNLSLNIENGKATVASEKATEAKPKKSKGKGKAKATEASEKATGAKSGAKAKGGNRYGKTK